MGKDYDNFYENMNECQYRLNNTVVMYDGDPYLIFAITPRAGDKIFRVYMVPLDRGYELVHGRIRNFYPQEFPAGDLQQANYIDQFMATEEGKKVGILRKHINSPAFNKFRPFPLGMMNKGGKTYYLERTPQRHREQGLTGSHIVQLSVNLAPPETKAAGVGRWAGPPVGKEFFSCVKADHPSLQECIENLRDPEVANEAAAFHRDCAVIRGPLDLLFLGVKGDVVGLVEEDKTATLAHRFRYLKETVENTNSFHAVRIKEK